MVSSRKTYKIPSNGNSCSMMYILVALVFTLAALIGYLVLCLTRTKDVRFSELQYASMNTNLIRDVPNSSICGGACDSIQSNPNIFNDPYIPPLNTSQLNLGNGGGNGLIPVNIRTQSGFQSNFSQVGILRREESTTDNIPIILPLMGRRVMNGRDKLQYYTISNTGSVNTKLPIRKNNRSCSNEYGCDEVSNGDTVYVEGYNGMFRATVYETAMYSYLPI